MNCSQLVLFLLDKSRSFALLEQRVVHKIQNYFNENKISLKSEKNGFEYFEDSHLKFQDNKKTVQKISKKDFERKMENKKNIFFLSKIK